MQNVYHQLINVQLNLLLLIYILMNTLKDYNIIHLQLIQIDVPEVVILLMTCLIKYAFQIKLKI